MSATQQGSGPIRWFDLLFITTTSAVATGDVIANTQLIHELVFNPTKTTAIVQSMQMFDGDAQGIAMDVVLLNQAFDMGTENSPVDITDVEALSIQGIVNVVSGDWTNLIAHQYAQPQFNPFVIAGSALDLGTDGTLYAAVVARDSGTFAGSLLRMRLGVVQ